jgi:hypothetical protein
MGGLPPRRRVHRHHRRPRSRCTPLPDRDGRARESNRTRTGGLHQGRPDPAETQATSARHLGKVVLCQSCSACEPTMPRRSSPSSWPTASTSPPRSPTAVMSSTIGSPSGTVPCWPSRRPASAPSTYSSPRTARSWAGSTWSLPRAAPQNSATGSRSTSQAAAWRPRPSGSCAVWRRRNTGCARSRRPPPARTPRHRRCWPGLGSSRPARQTRPTSAVSKAPGISVTWCSPSAVPYWFVVTPCRGHAAWARFCCRGWRSR